MSIISKITWVLCWKESVDARVFIARAFNCDPRFIGVNVSVFSNTVPESTESWCQLVQATNLVRVHSKPIVQIAITARKTKTSPIYSKLRSKTQIPKVHETVMRRASLIYFFKKNCISTNPSASQYLSDTHTKETQCLNDIFNRIEPYLEGVAPCLARTTCQAIRVNVNPRIHTQYHTGLNSEVKIQRASSYRRKWQRVMHVKAKITGSTARHDMCT